MQVYIIVFKYKTPADSAEYPNPAGVLYFGKTGGIFTPR